MQGLVDLGVIEHVHVLTGVSGSTYSMAWLYNEVNRDSKSGFSQILMNQSKLSALAMRVDQSWGTSDRYAGMLVAALTGRLKPIFDGISRDQAENRLATLDPLRLEYEEMIRDVFLTTRKDLRLVDLVAAVGTLENRARNPQTEEGTGTWSQSFADNEHFQKAKRIFSEPQSLDRDQRFKEEIIKGVEMWKADAELAAAKFDVAGKTVVPGDRLGPYPIFVHSAAKGSFDCGGQDALSHSTFEVTPLRIGSDGLGYAIPDTTPQRHGLVEVVAISAAAVDNPCLSGHPLVELALGRLGARYPSYPAGPYISDLELYASNEAAHKDMAPFVADHKDLVAADGGINENLGLFPALRRFCKTSIVVDAGEDPHLVFDDYGKLQRRLVDEYGLTLENEVIKKIVARTRAENSLRPTDACMKASFAQDGCFQSQKISNLLFEISLKGIPIRSQFQGEATDRDLRILYAKLGVDVDHVLAYPSSYPEELSKYVEHLRDECGQRRGEECAFPHDPTISQHFSKERWLAYMALGRHLAQTCLKFDPTTNNISRSSGCATTKSAQ